jgi:glycosyltransferase involved in cell wall biosynthesis
MVTPMVPESAIADVMMQAVPDLVTRWDLEVWCPWGPNYLPCPVPLHPFREVSAEVLTALGAYDLVVYVLGDSPLHTRILPLARRLPGLVVLHDASVTNLVRHTALECGTFEELMHYVRQSTGEARSRILGTSLVHVDPEEWIRFCAEVPLTELALEGSLGAVVHSKWHARQVDGLTLGQVAVAPLPEPSESRTVGAEDDLVAERLMADLPDDAVLLVTVGSVNTNRRIDQLLEAIAGDEVLARRMHLWAVGSHEEKNSGVLIHLARSLGLRDRFAITDRVSGPLLSAILARADVAAALRDPVLEGQSASTLTQLASGVPVVVYDHAHYAELPDDVVVKVDPRGGPVAVREALRLLTDDEPERARRGVRGREYVAASRSGACYAAAIAEAGEHATETTPLLHLSADLGARLRRLGLHEERAVLDVVTGAAFDLFDLA